MTEKQYEIAKELIQKIEYFEEKIKTLEKLIDSGKLKVVSFGQETPIFQNSFEEMFQVKDIDNTVGAIAIVLHSGMKGKVTKYKQELEKL